MNNAFLDGMISRPQRAKARTDEPKDRTTKISQTKMQREIRVKKRKQNKIDYPKAVGQYQMG